MDCYNDGSTECLEFLIGDFKAAGIAISEATTRLADRGPRTVEYNPLNKTLNVVVDPDGTILKTRLEGFEAVHNGSVIRA